MSRKCQICGKAPSRGRRLLYRGLPKRKGGIGLKITGNAKRWFYPNIQKVKVIQDGTVRRARVCTACIRSGRVAKAPVRPSTQAAREERRDQRVMVAAEVVAAAEARAAAAAAAADAAAAASEARAAELDAKEQEYERRRDREEDDERFFED